MSNGSNTFRVKDIRPGAAGSDPEYLTRAGKRLFFFADNGAKGSQLWIWKPQ